MNYTKGEWKLEFDRIRDKDKRTLAIVLDGSYEEKVSNAQLIASAPDLYEALKTLRDLYTNLIENSRTLDFWVKADKALAKAESK